MRRRVRIGTMIVLVIALLGAGGSVSAAFGTPQKIRGPAPADAQLAASASRLRFLDKLRNSVSANPNRYGGVATAGDARVVLCDNGSGPDPSTDAAISNLRALGASVAVRSCKHTLSELNRDFSEVVRSSIFVDNGVQLEKWGIQYTPNVVEIGVDRIPAGFAAKVAAIWGDAVTLFVAGPVELAGSRTGDFPPFYGGDAITNNTYDCTSGFTLTNLYGTLYSITAGHCFAQGNTVWNDGWDMGAVNFRRWGGCALDNELVGGGSYAGSVWVGGPGTLGNTGLPVHLAANSCNGCYVYTDGNVTGQALVQLSGDPWCDNLGGVVSCGVQDTYGVDGTGCTHGDSGGPVFAHDGNGGLIAVGIIHSTGSYNYCGYTQLPPVLSYWQSTITTG